MKIVKAIFYSIVVLIMAGCAGILVCAFNPSLTEKLANKISGGETAAQGIYADIQPGVNAGWVSSADKVNYEPPGSRPAQSPALVSGRNGYEPVQEDTEQILQEEADNLSGNVGMGDIGSGLTFDEDFYPYYAMLEPDMKQLYNQIYANAHGLRASFAPVVPVGVDQLKSVFEAVYNDHPELFWLDGGYSCKYLRSGSCVEITLKFNSTADYLDDAKQDFDTFARRILLGAAGLGSDYEKEVAVHDALMGMADYNLNASLNQSAYSALVQGQSVCAGYARAYQYLMQQLGIPCYYCTGYAGEDHAWNIVKLDGNYYNVDVTWDDTNPSTYDYFNKSDKEFADTHMRTGLSVYLPACVTESEDAENVETASGASANAETAATAVPVEDLINPNPIEPLTWSRRSNSQSVEDVSDAATPAPTISPQQVNLDKAGLTADEVSDTLQEYYEECRKLLKEVGMGDKQFSTVIPEALWNTVERAYNSGEYWNSYVSDALNELGAENFVVNLETESLGGGYFRVYHNVYTY